MGIVAEDIIDLPNYPTKQKTDPVIKDLQELIRRVSEISES